MRPGLARSLTSLVVASLVLVSCSGDSTNVDDASSTTTPVELSLDLQPTPDAGLDGPGVAEGTEPRQDGVVPTPLVLTTEDGQTLSANVFGDGAVGVILAHMRGRDQSTWFPFAQDVASAGHTALTLDFRGYGDSSGERDENLAADLVAAVEYFAAQDASAIIVVGASMGGTAAINVASEWNLGGVISLSAPGDFRGMPATAVADQVGEPLLLVVAEQDEPYATDAQEINERALTSQLTVLPGRAHGTELFASSDPGLTQLLLGFIDDIT